ncbi:type I-E CRISPR-associated endoribonuclease Cas2e [Nesterenkonia aerolata]|uniref:Type I-E CRISPR-associated endoribonuclease Cas2e n=1 Tax=Nesterenkonia aerolata TaxID=3074079 RepID=A0ABU2DS64_9MICC|nr:type I-E CRISPR-associated endoribonuclease Cas2e [Nesterenkonia sp. LY-0111]MDR8019342.1 type I-E CRISPR-associated endoribonuclease Cas2e [Nesterenkonia sp. LY-0111]
MIVLVLTSAPPGLRGDLTKWLLEVSPGVFVGHVNTRVREKLWARVTSMCRDGRALLIYSTPNEQHLSFDVHDHHWEPVDLDGITVMRRPARRKAGPRKTGWSIARRQKRAQAGTWRRRYDDDESARETT